MALALLPPLLLMGLLAWLLRGVLFGLPSLLLGRGRAGLVLGAARVALALLPPLLLMGLLAWLLRGVLFGLPSLLLG
ncbi:hypothetical protein C7E14_23035, partial [Stenotrophomonas maltophilia]